MDASNMSFMLEQLLSLKQHGLNKSCLILADIMLANSLSLSAINSRGLMLMTYADSLYKDQQYRRALHYYRQSLVVLTSVQSDLSDQDAAVQSNEVDIKWKMYRCFFKLKEYQEALDILLSIPVKLRSVKIQLTLAKLYHHYKRDSNSAIVYYRMVLMQCPFAVEAVLALLQLGISLAELAIIFKQHPQSLISINWLNVWLKVQENVAFFQYNDAIKDFETLSKLGFTLSSEMNSQAGWCMSKLLKRQSAIELFKKARVQDPFVLSHTDTFARLLSMKSSTPNDAQLADNLLTISTLHFEPWLAKAWSTARKTSLITMSNIQIMLNKIDQVTSPVEPAKPEKGFFFGAINLARRRYEESILYFQEAIRADPSFFEAYESMLRCYNMCRGYKAAYSAMNRAIKSIKIPAQQYYLEAVVLSNRSETEARARQCLENAVKADKTFEKASIALCQSLRQAKELPVAIELLNGVLEQYQTPSLHYELGKCFEVMRKRSDALQQYELALRMDPDHTDAHSGLMRVKEGNTADPIEEEDDDSEEMDAAYDAGLLEGIVEFDGDIPEFPIHVLDLNEEGDY